MSTTVAYFDMDYTVLDTSSGLEYVKHLRAKKRIGARLLLHIAWWTLLYKVSAVDMNRAVPQLLSYVGELPASQLMAESDLWVKQILKNHITKRGLELIRSHREKDHHVVLISASTQFAVQPVAEEIGVDYLCTQLIVENDRMTGAVLEPPCYGEGKIIWAQHYAENHAATLETSYFYTDSYSDRPLLERVGYPIAVNPDTRLKRLAQRRGWPIEKFY